MNSLLSDNIISIFYTTLWVITFVIYHWRYRRFDAGSAIMLTYISYSIFSILTINDLFFSDLFEPLTLFPYIYLFVMLIIALSPAIYTHFHPTTEIANPNTRVIAMIGMLIIFSSILLVPDIVSNFSDGLVKLFVDSDAGKENYEEQSSQITESGSGISNIPAIIYNAMMDLGPFLCFYYLSQKKKNRLMIMGLIFSMTVGVLLPIMRGQRGGVITSVLTVFVAYMLFRQYINKRINHWIQVLGIVAAIIVSLPVVAISLSRFGDTNGGIFGFINWYIGQANLYFNNYAMDNGGIRYGDRTINLFKRVVFPDTPKNYEERRWIYRNLEIDDDLFSTFVGDFVIDFGPTLAFIIFVSFNIFVLFHIRAREGIIDLHKLLLLYFTLCVCMQGGMTLFSFSDSSNLRMIVIFSLYSYLRVHKLLLQKFPLRDSDK